MAVSKIDALRLRNELIIFLSSNQPGNDQDCVTIQCQEGWFSRSRHLSLRARGVIDAVRVGSKAARERGSVADRRVGNARVYLDDQREDSLWPGERALGY